MEPLRGSVVLVCSDEGEAYAYLQKKAVSAIVLEITANHEEDENFVTAARARPGYGNRPITVCATIEQRRPGAAFGVVVYLVGPVVPTVLLDAVNQAMARSGPSPRHQPLD